MRGVRPGLVALALAAMAAAPVRAADMAVPYYPPKATYMPPALYNWTGIYGGVHVGAGLLSDKVTYNSAPGFEASGTSMSLNPYAVLGGGQIGANVEFAPWVVGVEGSFTDTNLSGSVVGPTIANVAGLTPIQSRWTSAPNWLAAATVRAGYALDTLLLYVKGGGAWMSVDYKQSVLDSGGITFSTTKFSDTRSGFTAGTGLEYGMTENLSAKLEYDFYDFGSKSYSFLVPVPAAGTPTVSASVQSYVHVFTVGFNYRFTPDGAHF